MGLVSIYGRFYGMSKPIRDILAWLSGYHLVDFGDIYFSYGVLFFGWGWFSSFSWLEPAHNNILFSYIEPRVWCMSAPRQTFAVV